MQAKTMVAVIVIALVISLTILYTIVNVPKSNPVLNPTATPNPTETSPKPSATIKPITLTYWEVNRTFSGNFTVIFIDWSLGGSSVSYNPNEFYLVDNGVKISMGLNDFVYPYVTKQYPLLSFAIQGIYNGTSYQLANDYITEVGNNNPVTVVWEKINNSENESLTLIDSEWSFHGVGGVYDWNFTAIVKNTGNVTLTIKNIVINGQSYTDMYPAPTISPSIKNGYKLYPNQTLEIFIHEKNSATQPFSLVSGDFYIVSEAGRSYLIYQYTS
jgi:hypothetical protein